MRSSRDACLPLLAEVFREHGYDGASLSVMSAATGLTNGSLYHFFPGGKDEMLGAVLESIGTWFESSVFVPLRSVPAGDRAAAEQALQEMARSVSDYFRSGKRVCLGGVISLSFHNDRFATAVSQYFTSWIDALAHTLTAYGSADPTGQARMIVATVQGAIVLARAFDDPEVFDSALALAIPGAVK
ncbi:TetR/AcrR family transcriptional regulator [Cryptosporangium sp. NPDC048952]|uniref:TetR/AcrR family transcriptional regulator n=1 Tax=Cryptosporangium sp. NPDC048952 TaxID=3363961 RepID=UPI003724B744